MALFNRKALENYLKTGEYTPPPVSAEDMSLAEHDARWHPDGYKKGDKCLFRANLDKGDKSDADLANATPKEGGISGIYTGGIGDFTNPSVQYIGTGEGTQVYGWGLYGASLRNDAEYYAAKAQANYVPSKGDGKQKIYEQTFFVNRPKGDESHLLSWYGPVTPDNKKRVDDALIDISGHPMDWSDIRSGEDLYQKLADFASPKEASEFLYENADIDGIKYPAEDHHGRKIGNQEGWNYVAFSDDNIRVDRKWRDGEEVDDAARTKIERYLALDAAPMSLAAHDRLYHHGLFTGGRCLYRANQSADDPADALLVNAAVPHSPAPNHGGSAPTPTGGGNLASEIEDVKSLYTKPDGTHSKGWLRAPNGKPSNLTPDQWCLVRTPTFKKWFGDWEREAELDGAVDFALNGNPAASITGNEFQQTGNNDLIDRVSDFYRSVGGKVENPELGDVILDRRSVKSSLGHGIGREKASAFAAVPDVIRHGIVFDRQPNWKGRGPSFVLVAPIRIGKENFVCEAIVEQSGENERRFYLHEVNLQSLLSDTIKTPTGGASIRKQARPLRSILAKLHSERKGASKIVDSNGEPKPLLHYTEGDFDFNDYKFKDNGVHKAGTIWFCADEGYVEFLPFDSTPKKMWGFLNIKNPLDLRGKKYHGDDILFMYPDDGRGATAEAIAQLSADSGISIPELRRRYKDNNVFAVTESADFAAAAKAQGYDGLLNDEFGYATTAVFSPDQIMSTTEPAPLNLRAIADAVLAEDAAIDPDFESRHPRGNSANKGQFRKSEKTLAKLDEADASVGSASTPQSGGKVSPAEDAAYLAAVKNGDIATAKRMIREVAGRVIPTLLKDEDGLPLEMYHGSDQKRNVFKPFPNAYGLSGVNFIDTYGRALDYAMDKWATPENVERFAQEYPEQYEELAVEIGAESYADFADRMRDLDEDTREGIMGEVITSAFLDIPDFTDVESIGGARVAVAQPNQIYSSEVTYDDDGNPIPLSKRFNRGNNDIRY